MKKFKTDYITNHEEGLDYITSFTTPLFVNKSHTGMGGTTAFLQANKNICILSPNAGMVKGKEKEGGDTIFIHGSANGKWTKAINKAKEGNIVKINATWASLQNLYQNTRLFGEVNELFHFVVDEVHNIYTGFDSANSKLISMTELISNFLLPYVLTTATPISCDPLMECIDNVLFYKEEVRDLTIYIAEDNITDVSDILSLLLADTDTVVIASNNSSYTSLYETKHQVLAGDTFKLKSNSIKSQQINNLLEVDSSCDIIQISSRYNTGFDIFGEYHSIVLAELNQNRDTNVDGKTYQEIRQSIGRLRNTPKSISIIYRANGQHRSLESIKNDMISLGNNEKLIREYALSETYSSLDSFKSKMEGYGYNVTVQNIENLNNVRRGNLVANVDNILANGDVYRKSNIALNSIKGDNDTNIGVSQRLVVAYIISNLIEEGLIDRSILNNYSNNPDRVYKKILDILSDNDKYKMYYDFIKIYLYNNDITRIETNNCPSHLLPYQQRIFLYDSVYSTILNNFNKLTFNEKDDKIIKLLNLQVYNITKNVEQNVNEYLTTEENKAIFNKLFNKLKLKIKKAIKENKTIEELRRELIYTSEYLKKRWINDNLYLFCLKYELSVKHFKLTEKKNREYNPITKSETWTRQLLPIKTYIYDIKSAYSTFIDNILNINVGKGVYERIMKLKGISRPEAKVYYNVLINNHREDIEVIKTKLSEIGYDKVSISWLAPKIKNNEMYEELTAIEECIVNDFKSYFGRPMGRIHDGILTFEPASIKIKNLFLSRGIEFDGEFTEYGQSTLTSYAEAIEKIKNKLK